MKIDIYNYILDNLSKYILKNFTNNKYFVKDIFDSIIYILKSNVSWNTTIYVNNTLIKTNSIYKHFRFLSNIHFFKNILSQIINTFYADSINKSNIFLIDSSYIFNKRGKISNIKRNPYKCNKYGYKIEKQEGDKILINRYIQRDKNAVLNFRTLFNYYLLNNRERPKAFQQTYLGGKPKNANIGGIGISKILKSE
jgi:hypothetical protein